MARIVSLCLLAVTLAGAAQAADEVPPADDIKTLYQKGKTEFDLSNYGEAVKYFEALYRKKPIPGILYNIAQCYRFVGNLDKAATSFRAFLRNATPDDRNIAQAKALLAEVEKAIAQREKSRGAKPQGLAGGATPPSGLNGAASPEVKPPPDEPLAPAIAKPAPAPIPPPAAPALTASNSAPTIAAPAPAPTVPPPATKPSTTTPPGSTPGTKLAVTTKPEAPPIAKAPSSAVEDTPPPPSTDKPQRSHLVTYIVGGVGLATLGVGGYFGLQSKSLQSDLNSSNHQTPQIDSDYATAQGDASKGNALMIGGAVLIAAAGVLFFLGY